MVEGICRILFVCTIVVRTLHAGHVARGRGLPCLAFSPTCRDANSLLRSLCTLNKGNLKYSGFSLPLELIPQLERQPQFLAARKSLIVVGSGNNSASLENQMRTMRAAF